MNTFYVKNFEDIPNIFNSLNAVGTAAAKRRLTLHKRNVITHKTRQTQGKAKEEMEWKDGRFIAWNSSLLSIYISSHYLPN